MEPLTLQTLPSTSTKTKAAMVRQRVIIGAILLTCLLLANVLVVAYLVFRLGQRKHPGASPTS